MKTKPIRNKKRIKFIRVNRSICINEDNNEWRRHINRKDNKLPRLIKMQGRSILPLYISDVGKYIYRPIINEEEKTVYYKKVKCDICHSGYIKINKYGDKQCTHCGYIYESTDLNTTTYIEEDINKESIYTKNKKCDILKYDWQEPISKYAKEINARYKRIREYEKGNKDYQT